MMINRTMLLILTGLVAIQICKCDPGQILQEEFYTPPIYLAGNINDDYDSLYGNDNWMNTCSLDVDTVKIYLYSPNFSQSSAVRNGDMIRISFFPGDLDSIIETDHVLFHMARYIDGTNISYNISPMDSANTFKRIQIFMRRFERRRGGLIDLDQVYVTCGPVKNGAPLSIKSARIRGRIQ